MNVIILGASARAAAFSALRAGLRPWCADLFADADLARVCPVQRVAGGKFPASLVRALTAAPDGPVLYTGGLENHPEWIERIERSLWGNPADVIRSVRCPFQLADALARRGLPALAVRRDPPAAGDRRQWLLKPLHSGGGLGIRRYRGQSFNSQTHYFQEYVAGWCFGALFLGLAGGRAQLLGLTALINSLPWLHAPAFHYTGNFGPIDVETGTLQAVATLLAEQFSLRGLFGVDVVYGVDANGVGEYRPMEVNPRYTASVEIFERAWGTPLLELHRRVFDAGPVTFAPRLSRGVVHGKAILYARDHLIFPAKGPWLEALEQAPGSVDVEYADIPRAGEPIACGRPVLTVFAFGATDQQCLLALRRKAEALDRCLWGS
jgi:predicted ATP-grasp superfamily ATP-dependent carboligase